MIKIGIIGYGYWGPNIVRNFDNLKDCQVKMVSDLRSENLEKIKELYPHILGTKDYKDILKDPEIKAVVIVTPASTHYSLIKEALLCGKHVLSEKPITTKADEGEELVLLAQKEKKILMVGHTFEYSSSVRKAKEILKSGELGKIRFIYSNRLSPGPIRSDVNVIWDFGFHDISILTYLLNKNPLRVSARGKAFLKKDLEDFGFIELEFSGNITTHIRVSWLYPVKERGAVIVGDKKMLIYNDTDPEKPLVVYNKEVSRGVFRDQGISWPEVKIEEPLRVECQHFLDCLKNNEIPLTDGKRGVQIVKILEAVQKSLDLNGQPIELKYVSG